MIERGGTQRPLLLIVGVRTSSEKYRLGHSERLRGAASEDVS